MSSRWLGILVSLLFALPALAEAASSSRLDAVQKSGRLRVCTPGDYTPFALQKQEGMFEGLDVDLVQTAAKALGAEAVFVKSAWPTLMKDFVEKCDVAVGGISVTLERPFDAGRLKRNFYATSSCGICGKAALEDVEVRCAPVAPGPVVSADVLVSLPETLRSKQKVFDRTGGIHAAGLFTAEGELMSLREDVGRHNAVDKVIGEQLLADHVPLSGHILQVSGRASFEIVQKAAVAGIPIVSAVSAPSSLAVEAGERFGMTIVGFVRDGRCNVYTHPERVLS